MAIHSAQMGSLDDKTKIFNALTTNSAKTMGLENYGLEKGRNADLILLQARDPAEALRLKATKLLVIKAGQIIARTAPRISQLSLVGRPEQIDPATGFAPDY